MNENLKLLAIVVLTILVGYAFFNYKNLESTYVQSLSNNSELTVEGFEDRGNAAPEVAEKLETLVNQIDDSLLVTKYRKDYEKAILKADDLFELLKIDSLHKLGAVKYGEDEKFKEIAEEMAMFQNAKAGLGGALDYIDGK